MRQSLLLVKQRLIVAAFADCVLVLVLRNQNPSQNEPTSASSSADPFLFRKLLSLKESSYLNPDHPHAKSFFDLQTPELKPNSSSSSSQEKKTAKKTNIVSEGELFIEALAINENNNLIGAVYNNKEIVIWDLNLSVIVESPESIESEGEIEKGHGTSPSASNGNSSSGGNIVAHRVLPKRSNAIVFDQWGDDEILIVGDKEGIIRGYLLYEDSVADSLNENKPTFHQRFQKNEELIDFILLGGHTASIITSIAMLTVNRREGESNNHNVLNENKNQKFLISADRDECIRVSQYPFTNIIESYCLQHETFVSCLVPGPPIVYEGGSKDSPDESELNTITAITKKDRKRKVNCTFENIFISGGGDGQVIAWNAMTGEAISSLRLTLESLIPKRYNSTSADQEEEGEEEDQENQGKLDDITESQNTTMAENSYDANVGQKLVISAIAPSPSKEYLAVAFVGLPFISLIKYPELELIQTINLQEIKLSSISENNSPTMLDSNSLLPLSLSFIPSPQKSAQSTTTTTTTATSTTAREENKINSSLNAEDATDKLLILFGTPKDKELQDKNQVCPILEIDVSLEVTSNMETAVTTKLSQHLLGICNEMALTTIKSSEGVDESSTLAQEKPVASLLAFGGGLVKKNLQKRLDKDGNLDGHWTWNNSSKVISQKNKVKRHRENKRRRRQQEEQSLQSNDNKSDNNNNKNTKDI